jgi:hypothetical protein
MIKNNEQELIQNQVRAIFNQIDSQPNKTKILFIVPESAGDIFLSTSLLSSLHDMYSPCDIYFACKKQFFDILENNSYIHKKIEYLSIMENQTIMEGTGSWSGIFDISIMVTVLTQRLSNYLNNGKGKLAFQIRKKK